MRSETSDLRNQKKLNLLEWYIQFTYPWALRSNTDVTLCHAPMYRVLCYFQTHTHIPLGTGRNTCNFAQCICCFQLHRPPGDRHYMTSFCPICDLSDVTSQMLFFGLQLSTRNWTHEFQAEQNQSHDICILVVNVMESIRWKLMEYPFYVYNWKMLQICIIVPSYNIYYFSVSFCKL